LCLDHHNFAEGYQLKRNYILQKQNYSLTFKNASKKYHQNQHHSGFPYYVCLLNEGNGPLEIHINLKHILCENKYVPNGKSLFIQRGSYEKRQVKNKRFHLPMG